MNKEKCPNCYRSEFKDCGPCGAANKPGDWCLYFTPSNGTAGTEFCSEFCDNCIHQHPDPENERQCRDILLVSLLGVQPAEWVFDYNRNPTCTAFVRWDWGNEDDGWNDPPGPEPDDPNQLVMPFSLMEILGEDWNDLIVTPIAIYETDG